jgi:hypothetical protein
MSTKHKFRATLLAASFGSLMAASNLTAFAAAPVVKAIKFTDGEMPFVVADDARVANRINVPLYLDILRRGPPAKLQDGIPKKKVAENERPPTDVGFKVSRSDERVVSITISAEGCGAYCENYSTPYNFDAATGRYLTTTDLFSAAGNNAIKRQLDAFVVARVNKEIARLRALVAKIEKKGAGENEDAAASLDAIEMYQGCAKSAADPEMDKYRNFDEEKFSIGKDGVSFIVGRCSNHAMRALDELGEHVKLFTFKELSAHLSEYGAMVLESGKKVAAPAHPFNQVLVGKVGQSPITVWLGSRRADGEIGGYYYYDKFRTPIRLFGKVKGNVLEVDENDGSDRQTTPKIRATLTGDSLKGQWMGNGKQIAFEAAP